MGRHEITAWIPKGSGDEPAYKREYGKLLGARIKRLRLSHGLRLMDLAERVYRPGRPGQPWFSASYFSRIERGYTSAALYGYIAIAEVFELSPGRLLGLDDWDRHITEAEMTLLRFLREAGIEPHVAIAKITAS